MTNPRIAPRVDDDGVRRCDYAVQCPQRVNTYDCDECPVEQNVCEIFGTVGDDEVCPVWAKRMVAENRALREWAKEAKEERDEAECRDSASVAMVRELEETLDEEIKIQLSIADEANKLEADNYNLREQVIPELLARLERRHDKN